MKNPVRRILERKGHGVWTIHPGATLDEAARRMADHRIGALLVEMNDRPVGMISERDLVGRAAAEGKDFTHTWVSEIMTRSLLSISPDTTVEEAMALASSARCRHLPVVEDGSIIGLVSSGDLTAWVLRDQAMYIDDLVGFITLRW